ncbi:MAG: hypothetical protein MJ196_11630 [Treponemataceae bacterium]|nr:hypothetical protein [Treponemataceae bacterium]
MDDTKKYPPFDEEAEKKSYIENQEYKEFAAAQRNALKPTGATYKNWVRHYLKFLETCKNIQDYAEAAEYFEKNPFDIDLTIDNYNEYQAEAWATSNQISLFDLPNPNIAIDSEKKYLNTYLQDYISNTVYSFCACSAFMTAYCLWESKESGRIVYDAAKDKAIFDILEPFGEILTIKGYANTEKKAAEIIVNMDENAIPALFSALEDVQNTVQSEYLITFTNKAMQSLFEFAEKYGKTAKTQDKTADLQQDGTISTLQTIQDDGFAKMLNNTTTNYIQRAAAQSRRWELDEETGDAKLIIKDVEIKINRIDYNKPLNFGIFASKLFAICLIKLTAAEQGDNKIILTTAQLCELMGKENTASARREISRQLKDATQELLGLTVTYLKDTEKTTRTQGRGNIIGDILTENGQIIITLNENLTEILQLKPQITEYPVTLLKIDGRNSTAFYIGNYIAEQTSTNFGKRNQNLFTVKKMIEISGLPSIEKVKQGNRHYAEKIIEPLENALDELTNNGILQSWEYCNANGEILTDEQLNSSSIDVWAEYRIKAIMKNYPSEEKAEMNRKKKLKTYKKKA